MRLSNEHFQYIIDDATDEVLFVDLELMEKCEDNAGALDTVGQYVVLAGLPDEVVFVEAIPRTSTGKFDKMALRERFADADVEIASDRETNTDSETD